MLNMLPDARWPMFRVGQPEDLPGFRIANDGSVGTTSGDSGLASFGRYLPDNAAPLVRIGSNGPTYASDGGVYRAADQAYDPVDGNPSWQDPARTSYANARDNRSSFFDRFEPFLTDVQDAAQAVGTRANAVVNGAYSVFPRTYNAIRALGRGIGVLGPEEFRRFGQEADFVGDSLGQNSETSRTFFSYSARGSARLGERSTASILCGRSTFHGRSNAPRPRCNGRRCTTGS